MKYVILAFLPIAFCFGLVIGRLICRRKGQAKSIKSLVNQNMTELVYHKTALIEIREGRKESAVEFLEYSLDCNVSALWHARVRWMIPNGSKSTNF
jgi:hypothetical protein